MLDVKQSNAPIEGKIIFIYSIDTPGSLQSKNHIYYDDDADNLLGIPMLPGALYKAMKAFPVLIEPILLMAQKAAEELSEQFVKSLKENEDKSSADPDQPR